MSHDYHVIVLDSSWSKKAPGGYITGEGSLNDVLYAMDYQTLSDIEMDSLDYYQGTKQAIKEYDWTEFIRDLLNDSDGVLQAPYSGKIAVETLEMLDARRKAWQTDDQGYPFGDYLELVQAQNFDRVVSEIRTLISDELTDAWPFNPEAELAPRELMDTLEKYHDAYSKEVIYEYLNGDRSDYGVLDQISKKLTGEVGNVDDCGNGDISFTFTDEQAHDFLGMDEEDEEPITDDMLRLALVNTFLNQAEARKSRARTRQAQRQEAAKLRASQAQKDLERRQVEARELYNKKHGSQ